jgi:integrase
MRAEDAEPDLAVPALAIRPAVVAAPVEYAVAIDRFLAEASLGPASRRIYRISLASWAWPLVGKLPPPGRQRRGATPPVVPLAVLDDHRAGPRLAAALAERARRTDARTVNRELSALRSAIGWWRDRRWISGDPTAGLRHVASRPAALPALDDDQLARLFGVPAGLREQALWHLIFDSGARADDVLALDANQLDLSRCRARASAAVQIQWRATTSELLRWLLAGRACGPVYLTDRRAPGDAAPADVCPLTGRGRMSYRRAAELFTGHTRPLDPAGRGWTLHQLRQAGQATPCPVHTVDIG